MSNPILQAIEDLRARVARGELDSVTIDTDDFEPLDDLDRAAIMAFFYEED